MNLIKPFIASLLFILLLTTVSFAAPDQEVITMTLPESVIQEAIDKSLPLEYEVQSETLSGSVSVDKIQNLQLRQDSLSSHITLSGHKLNIVTNVAGHNLRMKIGSLTMGFQCNATIRFDAQQQTLYVKPTISEMQSTDRQKTDVASALALLFSNQEFPLKVEDLKPIVTEAGNKLLSISMEIANISSQPGDILLSISPQFTSTAKKK